MLVIELPWPDKVLNPNCIKHWRVKYKAAKKARMDGYLLAKAALGGKPYMNDGGKIPMRIDVYPPDKLGRDLDNIIRSKKHAVDGIADALGVNDKLFSPLTAEMHEPVKGGKIVISLG